jgi:hypothetical protein
VIRSHAHDQALVEYFRADGGACNLPPRGRLRGMLNAAKGAFTSGSIAPRWRTVAPGPAYPRLSAPIESGNAAPNAWR